MKELEDFLKTHDAGTVLDIACGSGTFTKRLTGNLKSYTSVIGLDIKADSRDPFLETVTGHDVSFIASSIHSYFKSAGTFDTNSFDTNSFDTVTVSNALHHLEDVGEVLKSVRGILTDNGTVIINEMHRDDLTPSQKTQYQQHRFLADLQRAAGEYHRETWSRDEILGFITHAGLRVRHTFENNNEDALIAKEPGRLVERAQAAIEKAYPAGAPESVTSELDRLVARNNEIGSSSPPQLTLVCVGA